MTITTITKIARIARITRITATNRGMALAVSLFTLLMLSLLGFGVLAASRSSARVSHGYTAQKIAFQAAEGALDRGREQIRSRRRAGTTYTQMLQAARNGGTLVNPLTLANFGSTGGLVNDTTNAPFIASTGFGGASYQVFLTNDRGDGPTNATDTNSRLMLTAFGSGPSGVGFAVVQAEVQMALVDLPELPGVLTLPGPTVNFSASNSNARELDGDDTRSNICRATIAVSSAAAELLVDAQIATRGNRYTTCNPGPGPPLQGGASTENFLPNSVFSPQNPYQPTLPNTPTISAGVPGISNLIRIDYLTALLERIRDVADFTSTSSPGFTYGTGADPKIVFIDGDHTINGSGSGILVVTGKLKFQNTPNYTGLVFAIGKGEVEIEGGGSGTLNGSMLIANTRDSWRGEGVYVGEPTYHDNGGGNMTQRYDSVLAAAEAARAPAPLDRISYQQLR